MSEVKVTSFKENVIYSRLIDAQKIKIPEAFSYFGRSPEDLVCWAQEHSSRIQNPGT